MSQKKRSKVFPLLFLSLLLLASSCGQQQKQKHESEQELSWEDDRLRFVREIGRMNLSQIPGIVLTDEEKDNWFKMHEIIPTADEMSDSTFFQMLQLEEMPKVRDAVVTGDFKTAGLEYKEFFQKKLVQKQVLDMFFARKIDSIQVVEKAQQDLKEKDFGKKDRYYQAFTTWSMMYNLFLAYCLDDDPEYLAGCFRFFNFFYHELRPPAGTPDVYVSVNGTIDPWRTLMAANRLGLLITIKQVIDESSDIPVSPENYINLNKSIFELQDFLVRMNQKFYNSNWQIHQMKELLHSAVVFPELKNSSRIAQMAWQSILCHMERETLADGGHNERATSYSIGVINIYKHALIYAGL
ncbi:MAG: hypothetical protein K8R35_03680, partial [Bacteroidales bacterium]|nr:hypothetical protein [Bacteroidales bacterium]